MDVPQPDDRVVEITNLCLFETKYIPGLPQRGHRLGNLLVAPIRSAF